MQVSFIQSLNSSESFFKMRYCPSTVYACKRTEINKHLMLIHLFNSSNVIIAISSDRHAKHNLKPYTIVCNGQWNFLASTVLANVNICSVQCPTTNHSHFHSFRLLINMLKVEEQKIVVITLSNPAPSNRLPSVSPTPAKSVTGFSPIGSATKFLCFCEVLDIFIRFGSFFTFSSDNLQN